MIKNVVAVLITVVQVVVENVKVLVLELAQPDAQVNVHWAAVKPAA